MAAVFAPAAAAARTCSHTSPAAPAPHPRLLTAARTGTDLAQYPTRRIGSGRSRRAPDGRPPSRGGSAQCAGRVPDGGRRAPGRGVESAGAPAGHGGMRPVRASVGSLLREVEVHHNDLGCTTVVASSRAISTMPDTPSRPRNLAIPLVDSCFAETGLHVGTHLRRPPGPGRRRNGPGPDRRVDSTIVRAHQHAAGARQKRPRPASRPTMPSDGPAAG